MIHPIGEWLRPLPTSASVHSRSDPAAADSMFLTLAKLCDENLNPNRVSM